MSQRRAERVVESKFDVVTESFGAPRLRGEHPLNMPPTEYPPSHAVNETPSVGPGLPTVVRRHRAQWESWCTWALSPRYRFAERIPYRHCLYGHAAGRGAAASRLTTRRSGRPFPAAAGRHARRQMPLPVARRPPVAPFLRSFFRAGNARAIGASHELAPIARGPLAPVSVARPQRRGRAVM